MTKILHFLASFFFAFLLLNSSAFSQKFGGFDLGGITKSLTGSGNGFSGIMRQDPISTGIRNVNTEVDVPYTFMDNEKPNGLHFQPRTKNGAYVLVPGFYEMRVKSFCIQAGTHAPGQGDGYLFAPLAGRQADIFKNILKKWEQKPEIDQSDVQLLLWALLAKVDFERMQNRTRATAMSLMRPSDIARVNKRAIFKATLEMANIREMPKEIQYVLEAESKLRNAFYSASASYQQMEELAMLVGSAFVDNPQIKRGHWSKHPDGYYIRYLPDHYTKTIVQVFVPESVKEVEFDATDDVAVPMNTGAQRLAQSNIPYDTSGYDQKPIGLSDLIVSTEQQLPDRTESEMDKVDETPEEIVMADSILTVSQVQEVPVIQIAADTSITIFNPSSENVRPGENIVLKSIQFDQSKSELLQPGKDELDRVAEWLKKNENITVELSGHTSNEGQRDNNVRLSQERVEVCKKYLVNKKIRAQRIRARGYGPDKPLVSNDTEDKRLNRRVEMRIL